MLTRITRNIQEKLGLTKSEAAIILFLSLGLLIGGTVKLLRLDRAVDKYDFTESDSFFAEVSSKIDSILADEEDTLTPRSTSSGAAKRAITAPVNLNTASIEELTALPGVGRVIAKRIYDYRAAHGKILSIDELLNVKGIGRKKFDQMKKYVKAE